MSTTTMVLLALAPYAVPPLVTALVVLASHLLEKLPSKQRPLVEGIARSSVAAVEQMSRDGLGSAGKKQLAIEFVQKQLQHYNIQVPDAVVNALIEEAVLAVNTANRAQASSVVAQPLSNPTSSK